MRPVLYVPTSSGDPLTIELTVVRHPDKGVTLKPGPYTHIFETRQGSKGVTYYLSDSSDQKMEICREFDDVMPAMIDFGLPRAQDGNETPSFEPNRSLEVEELRDSLT